MIDSFRILRIELGLVCNRGPCGGISLNLFAFEKILLREPLLQASSSSIRRMRKLTIVTQD